VAYLDVAGHTICFAGDVEHDAEMELLARGACAGAAVLTVPHHGSRTSSDSAWIGALRPRIALISCGEGNRFGHPDRGTVGRYRLAGVRVYRTDREGAIRVTFTPRGALVSTRAHPSPELVPWR
jgi:competence protein ComEC